MFPVSGFAVSCKLPSTFKFRTPVVVSRVPPQSKLH